MKNIICFTVIFTFALGIIAPACGFAWGKAAGNGPYSVIEICGAQGIEKRIVQNDGEPAQGQMVKDQCQFCFSNANLNPLPPNNIQIDSFYSYKAKIAFIHYERAIASKSTSHEQPRGPPTLI